MSPPSRTRILFIDGDDKAAPLFLSTMDREDCIVDHAISGENGLSLYNENPYPLVLVNQHLDDNSGLDICRKLRKSSSTPVLILITARNEDDITTEALKLGVQNCVPMTGYHIYSEVLPVIIERHMHRQEVSTNALSIDKELRLSEERFLQSEVMSHSCHWESDNTLTNWDFASTNTENLLGVPIEDLLGNYDNYLRYLHPEDQERVRLIYAKAVENHEPYEVHYRFCRPDNQIIHLLEYAKPVLDDCGNISFYRGSTQDVTAQDDVEARYRIVVENAVEAMISIDSDGIIQSFNRAAEIQFQYVRSEVIGSNIKILMPEDISEQHDAYLARYLSDRQARILGLGREVEARRKDGTIFPALLSVSAHEIGGTVSFTGLLRDISVQKETETLLIKAKNEAERANRAKSEFLSSMSHELRTPLNAVLGFTQMLEYNPQEPLSPKQQESVDLIKRGGRHLLNLINEVLELAKIEAGRIDFSIETIDLTNTIKECASIARATAIDRDIELTDLTEGRKLPDIYADNTRLKQILLNLLSNAVKYNKDAGSITIDANETDDGFVRISVADTGIGLTPREMKKVFEPFERLGKQSEDVEGTGIGLTISQQLVNLMNGRMGFTSELGEGSTFWLELPDARHAKAIGQEQDKQPKRRKSDITTDLRGPVADPAIEYTVLYVEDNESNILLMNNIFSAITNATLQVVKTGLAGVEFTKQHKPDAVLMDINLPGMDGVEASKILQRKKETTGIPIIAVSASTSKIAKGVREDVGFFHCIEKPFDISEIRETIHNALMGRPE